MTGLTLRVPESRAVSFVCPLHPRCGVAREGGAPKGDAGIEIRCPLEERAGADAKDEAGEVGVAGVDGAVSAEESHGRDFGGWRATGGRASL